MAPRHIYTPESITPGQFAQALGRYQSLVETISASKGAKNRQETLATLDAYRYGDALSSFGTDPPKREMDLEDVKTLVNWKLRHGKFRPTLMKLVSSNDPSLAKDIVQEGLQTYRTTSSSSKALGVLTKMKGIGPATASLLLAVHDPQRVIFFADEAFYWLCCNGKKESIKYNAKEYQDLSSRANEITKRLQVSAVDVERVSFVLMTEESCPSGAADGESMGEKSPEVVLAKIAQPTKTAKRKKTPEADKADLATVPLRRSKRGKNI